MIMDTSVDLFTGIFVSISLWEKLFWLIIDTSFDDCVEGLLLKLKRFELY